MTTACCWVVLSELQVATAAFAHPGIAMDQEGLRAFWLHAQDGRICPWEQAKALGLREASRELHKGKTNLLWIAARVTKVGGGHPMCVRERRS